MTTPFKHLSWASATTGCPITAEATGDDEIVFTFGGRGGFEFAFDREALNSFLTVAATTLSQLEDQFQAKADAVTGRDRP